MALIDHNCIKCGKPYKDLDDDNYLCRTCLEEKKGIAARIDEKMSKIPKVRVMSPLEMYDAAQKGQRGFVRAKDLGINL